VSTSNPARSAQPEVRRPTPQEAVAVLLEGHERFIEDRPLHLHQDAGRRAVVSTGQHPFALILGCADSRVPPEVILDQGFGDLFVIRTTGHVVDAAVLGSVEYGLEELNIPLVVVLGHERCGAVQAAVSAAERGGSPHSHLARLVEAITPAVAKVSGHSGDVVDNAVRAHVRLVVAQLLREVSLLATRVAAGQTKLVGLRHDLDTGELDLLV